MKKNKNRCGREIVFHCRICHFTWQGGRYNYRKESIDPPTVCTCCHSVKYATGKNKLTKGDRYYCSKCDQSFFVQKCWPKHYQKTNSNPDYQPAQPSPEITFVLKTLPETTETEEINLYIEQ